MKTSITLLSALTLSLAAHVSNAGDHKHDHGSHDDHKHSQHQSHEAHVHGEAELNLIIDGQHLLLELRSPAANLLGFEHEPENPEQQAKLNSALTLLKDYKNVLTIKNNQCQLQSSNIESPFHHKHAHHDEDSKESHKEFHGEYEVLCAQGRIIETLSITLFQSFSGFEKINVQWISDNRQGQQTVTQQKDQLQISH